MKILALDTENNIWNKGNPFDGRFKSVCYSWADRTGSGASKWNLKSFELLRRRINEAEILIGFNAKYDIHVFRKLGINEVLEKEWWDCQLAEFILSNQTWRYPSLDEACERHGLGRKIDVIAEKYWKNGVQTEDIPWDELAEYAEQDAKLTLALYYSQKEFMSEPQKRLLRLQCMDLMILEEMEWNGLIFDEELCSTRAEDIKNQIREIEKELSAVYSNVHINFNSGDQLSAFLYGGIILEEGREHIGYYKSGVNIGQPKFKKVEIKHELPRLVEPLRGTELSKPGIYSTNADTLLKLRGSKATKHIIELIQKQTRLQTLLSKTYGGLVKIRTEMNWEPGVLHGQFNQCVAQTGRLSSSQPNVQNLDGEADNLFISRYIE